MPRFLDCPTYEVEQIYTCQPPEISPGWAGWVGCDMGCRVCDDLPGQLLRKAVRVHGKRWTLADVTKQGRDAHGRYHDMQAGRPHRVPLIIDVLRSPCWKNDGTECHGGVDVCDCHPGESGVVVPGTSRCEQGEGVGELLLGTFPDCIAYSGYEISANAGGTAGWMQCRLVHQHFNIETSLRAGRLFQSIFHRIGDSSHGTTAAGGGPGQYGNECSATMMAECAGKVVQSNCDQGYWWVGEDHPIYYHDGSCRQVFNFCLVSGNTAHIRDNDLFPLRDRGVIAAKNAVLAVLSDPGVVFPDGRDLRQLDYAGATLGNAWLDWWSRGVGMPEGMSCEDPAMIVATTFPNSYLKNSRCPVHAELIIIVAGIEMSLVPYKVDWSASPTATEYERQVHPYARVRISAQCGVRATLPNGECLLVRPWIPKGDPGHSVALGIVNPEPGEGLGCVALPKVSPAVDQIIYVDAEDRIVVPPLHVEWHGYLGAFSDPPTADRWVDAHSCLEGSSMTAKCLRLADALSGLQIPGWPAFSDSKPDDPNQVYGGHLELDFRNDIYENCCKGAP